MNSPRVLIITSSHSQLGNTGEQTGVWLEELAAPYYTFLSAGAQITIASPQGGQVPIDPKSELPDWQTDATRRFTEDTSAMQALAESAQLADQVADDFDLLFFPGGHGPMWDLGDQPEVARLINAFTQAEKPVGLVCHGVAALKGVRNEAGVPFVKGKRLTAFSNTEEDAVGLTEVVPFLLEDALVADGAIYRKGEDWSNYVVEDGLLVTGQNPQSSVEAAERTLALAQLPQD